ncbi:hypothetical protein WJX73_000095 [Symbiochloris irregularis]|uniref:glutathione gamma-glutamylcysteinyltransferase n=1 Tax=Symbiochloris irregularis TaxID=706552 RepID=A0AAW1P7C1_9CHLO
MSNAKDGLKGPTRTFFRRQLPCPPAVAFASPEGRQLLTQALADQTAESFFSLMEHFSMQDEPAFCGLASIAMVLNALSIDPLRVWKGPWRVFHEQLLDCCVPLAEVKQRGITLPQAACLARCNGADAEHISYTDCTLDSFRQHLTAACGSTSQHIIVSYSRNFLKQTGDGHFSPIGAYHSVSDHALILDTARFKYPPHWVSLADLYSAMQAADAATGQCRGYLRITRAARRDSSLFTLDISNTGWREVHSCLHTVLPVTLSTLGGSESLAEAVHVILQAAPVYALPQLLARRALSMGSDTAEGAACCGAMRCSPPEAAQQMLQELRSLELWQTVLTELNTHAPDQGPSATVDASSLTTLADQWSAMLLVLPVTTWHAAPAQVQDMLCSALKLDVMGGQALSVLATEIAYLQKQWQELPVLGAAQ